MADFLLQRFQTALQRCAVSNSVNQIGFGTAKGGGCVVPFFHDFPQALFCLLLFRFCQFTPLFQGFPGIFGLLGGAFLCLHFFLADTLRGFLRRVRMMDAAADRAGRIV